VRKTCEGLQTTGYHFSHV